MKLSHTPLRLLLALIAVALGTNSVLGQAKDQDLPSAEKVFADYIKATGGEEAHRAIKSLVSSGKMSIPEAGIEGEMTIYQMAPNKMLMELNLPQIGETLSGFDGNVGWSVSEMQGPMLMEDEQLSQMKVQADIHQYLNVAEHYSALEVEAVENFGDEDCYRVKASVEDSDPTYYYFSVESHLLVGSKSVQATPLGKLSITSNITGYKTIEGADVKMAFETSASFNGMTQKMVMDSVKANGEVEADKFNLPEEIAELVDDN